MQKKFYNTLLASLVGALLFTGCGSDSSSDENHDGDISKLSAEGKTFVFYNETTGSQYVVDPDHQLISSLDTNESSNFYMLGKEAAKLTYWPDETTGDPKIVMLKKGFSIEDANVTHQDFEYLGHFHGTDLAAHSSDEFDPSVASAAKTATLARFSEHLREQAEIQAEIQEALSSEGEELCDFYVQGHHEEDTNTTQESAIHYVLTKSAKVLFYVDGDAGLEKLQGQLAVNLSAASSCEVDKSGITASHAGVFIFLESTQRLYLVDSHGLDYHEHSAWDLSEFMPSGFDASQMIGFGEDDGEHDH